MEVEYVENRFLAGPEDTKQNIFAKVTAAEQVSSNLIVKKHEQPTNELKSEVNTTGIEEKDLKTYTKNEILKWDSGLHIEKKTKRCRHKKHKKETEDDESVIFIDSSVPKPIKSKIIKTKGKEDRKRRVKLGSMTDYNMQDLVIMQDVKVKSKKCNCHSIKVNMNIMQESIVVHPAKPRQYKFLHCTVPRERIVPQCFRSCFNIPKKNQSQPKRCETISCKPTEKSTKRDTKSQQKYKTKTPTEVTITSRRLTKNPNTAKTNTMYEDVTPDSFHSDSTSDEIDTLIKRAKERERKSIIKSPKNEKKLCRNKCLRINTAYSFSEFSDDSEMSRESVARSIHSRVTMVLDELDYSPTNFSPLTMTFDFPDNLEDDRSINEYDDYKDFNIPIADNEKFQGYSDIDTIKKSNFDNHMISCKKITKIEQIDNFKLDEKTLQVKEEIFNSEDHDDVIETAILSSPLSLKEGLDISSDIFVIKKR